MKFNFAIYIAIFINASGNIISAQTIERQVIANAGGYGENNGILVSWTLGEVATATLIDDTIILTQGFQQPSDTVIVNVVELSYDDIIVKIYPNPIQNDLIVEVFEFPPVPLFISISDPAGKTLIEQKLTGLTTSLDVSNLPSALYFIQLSDGKSWMKAVKIVKK